MEKLKVMKGKEVREEELKPVLSISKVLIVPLLIGLLFHYSQLINMAGVIAFLIFALLGYIDSKEKMKNE